MSSFQEGPRHAMVTATDRGPLVNIATWILMVTTILFTGFRMVSNLALRKILSWDDAIVAVAMFLAIAQSIAVSFTVKYGIGQHEAVLSALTLKHFQMAMLASRVLYVTTLAVSKLSLFFLLMRLISPRQRTYRTVLYGSLALLLLYLVAEVLTLSFQCSLPNVWNYLDGPCINIVAFWNFDTVFDMVSALSILILPILIIRPLNMRLSVKLIAISSFAFQIPICAFTVVRLVYLHREYNSKDRTWDALYSQIWTEINLHSTVIIANLPCVKVFLDSFNSTVWKGPSLAGTVTDTIKLCGYRSFNSPSSKSIPKPSEGRLFSSNYLPASNLFRNDGVESNVIITSMPEYHIHAGTQKATSDGSRGLGILKTTEWSVEYNGMDGLLDSRPLFGGNDMDHV